MKLSLSWLNEYVDVNDFFERPEELGAILTKAGLEFEGLENQRKQYEHVVIGKIIEKSKHPDADKLTLCQVDIGAGKTSAIVCGAKNHRQGDYVVVATPGAVLPGDFKIKKSKIRGVESLGMLCSEKELGLSDESSGILILKEGTPGALFSEVFNLNDVVLEISVTPNRADCLSHIGLARELSCLLDKPLKFDPPQLKLNKESTLKTVEVDVKNSELCPRYCGRLVQGVKVGPSPQWLVNRLQSVDMNSINNVVDATNFVMLELGQPLHAFDLSEIQKNKIEVSTSQAKEKFQTLDGTEIELTGEELVIRDGARAVALAGVVGGLNSGVTDKTTDLFIEAAYFSQKGVRQTSRRFGIDTDSSYRFSRGTDPEGVLLALDRVCQLIGEIAGGTSALDFYDIYPNPHKVQVIDVDKNFIEKKLGYPVDATSFEQWMKRLGCKVEVKTDSWFVTPPAYRWDLSIKEDLVEEFARLDGYDKVPEVLPVVNVAPKDHDENYKAAVRLQGIMLQEGYMQAMNYHFVHSVFQEKFLSPVENLNAIGLKVASHAVKVKNPLNEEVDVMRTSLLPGLFKNLIHNVRHGNEQGRLYELGACFENSGEGYGQFEVLSFVSWGQKTGLWNHEAKRPVVFDLKNTIESLLAKMNIRSFEWRTNDQAPGFVHPGQWSYLFCEGKPVGFVGTVHPKLLKESKVRTSVAVAELDWSMLNRRQPRVELFEPISAYPAVERDLAFVMPNEMSSHTVERELKKAAGPVLKKIEVFDVYRGEPLAKEEKSVSFKLHYQDQNETLDEKRLQQLQDQLIQAVAKKLSLKVR